MTEPVVKIPLSLAKDFNDEFRFLRDESKENGESLLADYYERGLVILNQAIETAEREAALDKLSALGQAMGEYEK